MGCNCKMFEIIIAIILIVFAFMEGVSGLNMWVIVIAAIVLLLHAWRCKNCGVCAVDDGAGKGKKKSRKK